MTVQKRQKYYVSEWVYYNDMPIDTVEDEPLSLFGSLEVAPDRSIAQDAIGSRMYQIDVALHNELEHHGLISRKISMIFPLVSCCSCVNKPSSS